MATASLLEAISIFTESKPAFLKRNPLLQSFPAQVRFPLPKNNARFIRTFRLSAKCALNSKKWTMVPVKGETNRIPLEGVVEAVLKAMKALEKPATTALLLGMLLTYDPHSASAASGGRMGGRSFSARSSSSSSRSFSSRKASASFSYSVPYRARSFLHSVTYHVFGALQMSVAFWAVLTLILFNLAVFAVVCIVVWEFLSGRSEDSVVWESLRVRITSTA